MNKLSLTNNFIGFDEADKASKRLFLIKAICLIKKKTIKFLIKISL